MIDTKKKILTLATVFILPAALYLTIPMAEAATQAPSAKEKPAKIEKLANNVNRITLTPRAAERLGIKTSKVIANEPGEEDEEEDRVEKGNKPRTVIPYSALYYDSKGNALVYTNPEPLVFIRQSIIVEDVDDDEVILSDGPPIGTEVVTVGVAELYGTETGMGK